MSTLSSTDQTQAKDCKEGRHDLIVISQSGSNTDDEQKVVRWCKFCGAVVVDLDYDGRTQAGRYRPMQRPRYLLVSRLL